LLVRKTSAGEKQELERTIFGVIPQEARRKAEPYRQTRGEGKKIKAELCPELWAKRKTGGKK